MKYSVIALFIGSFLVSGLTVADEAADKAAAKKMADAVNMNTARQGYMRLQAMQFGAMGKVGQGKAPITDDTIQRAQNLYNLTMMLPEVFAEGSGMDVVEDSKAKPEIWEQLEELDGFISRLNRQSERLLMLAKAGDAMGFKDEFKQIGGTCKKCHETFRHVPE